MIVVENGVPLPKWRSKYPLVGMAAGDSFFVPDGTVRTISGSVRHVQRGTGWKFVCRTVEENGVAGVRVWRLA